MSSRSSPTPTPSPASCTAPALRLHLLLPASSCCSHDRAPLRRRVHLPAPRCRPRCPSRAPGRTLRHARASPRALDRAKIPRPRAPPQLIGPLRTHLRPRIPALNRLSAGLPIVDAVVPGPAGGAPSSSRPAHVAPLTARPFGDLFTLSRLAAVLAAPLGPLAAHFVMRALPLAPWTVPKSPYRGLRRNSPGRSVLTLAPKFPL